MSIYSGFATRQQEESYDSLVEDLLFVLQKRLLKFYKNEEADQEKFLSIVSNIHTHLSSMEKHKYLQPKNSLSFVDLLNTLRQRHNLEVKRINANSATKRELCLPPSGLKKLNVVEKINHRDSFSLISRTGEDLVGRIKHQFSANHHNVQGYSEDLNPEQYTSTKRKATQESARSMGIKTHSHIKRGAAHDKQIPDIIKEYIEKTNKNYMKGYRKRKLKVESFHSRDLVK